MVLWSSFLGEPVGMCVTLLVCPALSSDRVWPLLPHPDCNSQDTLMLHVRSDVKKAQERNGKEITQGFLPRDVGEDAVCLKVPFCFSHCASHFLSFYVSGQLMEGIPPSRALDMSIAHISLFR